MRQRRRTLLSSHRTDVGLGGRASAGATLPIQCSNGGLVVPRLNPVNAAPPPVRTRMARLGQRDWLRAAGRCTVGRCRGEDRPGSGLSACRPAQCRVQHCWRTTMPTPVLACCRVGTPCEVRATARLVEPSRSHYRLRARWKHADCNELFATVEVRVHHQCEPIRGPFSYLIDMKWRYARSIGYVVSGPVCGS